MFFIGLIVLRVEAECAQQASHQVGHVNAWWVWLGGAWGWAWCGRLGLCVCVVASSRLMVWVPLSHYACSDVYQWQCSWGGGEWLCMHCVIHVGPVLVHHAVEALQWLHALLSVFHAALAETVSSWARHSHEKVKPCSRLFHVTVAGTPEDSPSRIGRISK